MHVLVCGGRDYKDRSKVFAVLDLVHSRRPITHVIHGEAEGADTFGREWAEARGVIEKGHEPDWDLYGGFAGNVRNQWMLDRERVDLVIAFPGGPGTRDMRGRAKRAGKPVLRVK
jgi:hypothetical protein